MELQMSCLEVVDIHRVSLILETFSYLDDIRWKETSNYNLINYCCDDLTSDEKLLTHYLCYIIDRQMPFMRIWDIGGYIISHLVRVYTREKKRDVVKLLYNYIQIDRNIISLKCPLITDNVRILKYGITGTSLSFSSRFPPEDLVLIYRTLEILNKVSRRSILQYIIKAINSENNYRHSIKKIASALDELTYVSGCRVKANEFDNKIESIAREVNDFVFDKNIDKVLSNRKRLWCSLRDYLKSPEFNNIFVNGLKELNFTNAEQWNRKNPELIESLDVLELPGDVWNNSEIFRKGLFSPYLRNERKSWDMPQTVREIFKYITNVREIRFYPEQLDVTFDFVPKMCDNDMCDICLFGDGIEKVCHQKAGLFCSVFLFTCGYRYICKPESCIIKKNLVKGFCKSSTTAL